MSSPAVASLSSRQVRHAFQALDGLRLPTVNSALLCREFGLSPAELEDPEARIPYATLDALLERAVELSGDDNLGLHMASLPVVDPDDMGSAVIATSPTLAESFERGARYQRVWGDGERRADALHPGGAVAARAPAPGGDGHGDPSVFHRAFKRWWGMSPETFRQRHGG